MQPFATVEDYRAAWPDDTLSDGPLLARLVAATSVMCREMELGGVEYANRPESFTEVLRTVCIAMVRRTRASAESTDSEIPFGATQFSQTAGSYTHSASLANPYGDIRMWPSERRLLGIGRGRACVASPYGEVGA